MLPTDAKGTEEVQVEPVSGVIPNGSKTKERIGTEEVQVEPVSGVIPNGSKTKERIPLHTSTSQRGLLGQEKQKGIQGSLTAFSVRMGFLKPDFSHHSLSSPSAKFRQFTEEKDEVSRSVPSSSSSRQGFHKRVPFLHDVNWDSLKKVCYEWIRDPMNMALFVWITCVAISGAILFMVMIGMLNHAIPKKSQRNAWFEVNNQFLNALFTLMCLYQHPKRFYHLVLLCRWKPEDIARLRKIYSKNGTYTPHEWGHMMVVVILLHVNCFAQYALCGLNLGYKRSERPAIGVAICISVAIAAPAIASLYTFLSPLGRDYEYEMDHEAQEQITIVDIDRASRRKSLEKRFSFALREEQGLIENRPKWKGRLFDIWDDISVAYLSLFCSFCVFGWNMERVGFGNMYVHVATFLLFCTAPFWIFNLAAVNVGNETVREAMGISGVVLCIFGLLYGGFWRIQLRKKFNLPANNSCCGRPAVADCVQWLCCCWCSLAQEVRTVDFYEIVEDKLCRKKSNETGEPAPSPLSREDVTVQLSLNQSSPPWASSSPSKLGTVNSQSPNRHSKAYDSPNRLLPVAEDDDSAQVKDSTMMPPAQSSMDREDQKRFS